MNEVFNKAFSFSKFREVHFGSFWKKIASSQYLCGKFTRPTSASDFLGIKCPKTWTSPIFFFASETNTFQFSYVESKNTKMEKKCANIDLSCNLKKCEHLIETTFFLRLIKILSFDGRARPRPQRSKKGQIYFSPKSNNLVKKMLKLGESWESVTFSQCFYKKITE
jgi:hypothetical protein